MTSNDYRLDPSAFSETSRLSLFRISKTEYANLSGVGAAIYPGRWNRFDQEAIYTSTEIGVPVLERLVHTPKASIPTNLSMMHIVLHGNWTFAAFDDTAAMIDEGTGGTVLLFDTLRAALAAFDKLAPFEEQPLAVALPSVIVPVWNFVLYPEGRAFWNHVELRSLSPFTFDARLFPETTPSDAESVPRP